MYMYIVLLFHILLLVQKSSLLASQKIIHLKPFIIIISFSLTVSSSLLLDFPFHQTQTTKDTTLTSMKTFPPRVPLYTVFIQMPR